MSLQLFQIKVSCRAKERESYKRKKKKEREEIGGQRETRNLAAHWCKAKESRDERRRRRRSITEVTSERRRSWLLRNKLNELTRSLRRRASHKNDEVGIPCVNYLQGHCPTTLCLQGSPDVPHGEGQGRHCKPGIAT